MKLPITLRYEYQTAETIDNIIKEKAFKKSVNEVGTEWQCRDDNGVLFCVMQFTSTPNLITLSCLAE